MNKLINNLALTALLGRSALNYRWNNRNRNRTYLTMQDRLNRTYNNGVAIRKRNRWNNGRKLEINNAQGGYKSVVSNGKNVVQVIDFYGYLVVQPNQGFQYAFDDSQYVTREFDISAKLNDNQEFLTLRKQALQYNITDIAININYNRVPYSGEKWSKLILTPETDKVLQSTDPRINRNSMVLDMSTNGNKNYTFKINRRNTDSDNAGWIIGEAQFSGICKIHISEAGSNYSNQQMVEAYQAQLGEFKISVRVVYKHMDVNEINRNTGRKRITDKEIIKEIANTELIQNKIKEKHVKEKEKQIQELKQQLTELTYTDINDLE